MEQNKQAKDTFSFLLHVYVYFTYVYAVEGSKGGGAYVL